MAISVSPYLIQSLSQASAPPEGQTPSKPAADSNPQAPATPGDSVTLSPEAQTRLNKTLIESTMERILDGVKNSTGPKLVFQPAIGSKLDQSC
jgi:hypothetical protein